MRPLFFFPIVFLALIFGVFQPSFAAPSNAHLNVNLLKLKESIPPPRNWIDLGRAPPTQLIPLRIALPQERFDELERHLYEMSDPYHSRYGQHFMKDQVEELVRPHHESVRAVDAWLDEYGITGEETVRRSSAGDWVTAVVPVALAEEMLDTEFHLWKHALDGDVLLRTTHYSLPEYLHAHVEFVQPTTYFGRPKAMHTTFSLLTNLSVTLPGVTLTANVSINITTSDNDTTATNTGSSTLTDPLLGVNCSRIVTVSCLQQLYNAVGYKPAATDKNAIGITGYLGQFANVADLQSFYTAERPEAVNSQFQTVLINNGQNDQTLTNAGPEANLDTQFGFGLTFPTPGTFYSTGGSPPFTPDALTPFNTNEPYDNWLQYVLNLPNGAVPQTISTSYSDDEQTVPQSYAVRVCKEFAVLGSRGVSILFSSGDGGVGDGNPDPKTQQCFTNDGQNKIKFLPHFPASCPFVTAVGGTVRIPEVAVRFSGGGFSNYFAQPTYQATAVAAYLASQPLGQYAGLFNPLGRAYPDVSAQAVRFLISFQGQAALISGTSAAAPTFAGIVTLLNDALLAAGKNPLGFLNPMLYSIGVAGLNDITLGSAPGCGTPGFNATKGWDPVTGLGTPDFGKLKDILSTFNPPAPSSGGLLGGLLDNLLASVQLKLL
ncbi:tripeptidyl peptidase A [Lactifluus subvellereus]|nr:tripeptidyl peptidase A [Lactifluus subvellereus]